MAPLLSSFAGASAKAFGMLSGVLKPIQDLFARTTTVSLGVATSGQTWVNTRGTWFANGSAAQSNDAASSYPLSSIPFTTNATMNADVTGGVGLAFWTSDSANWWGAYPFYSSVTNPVSACNANYQTLSNTSSFCGGYTTNPGYTACDAGYQTLTNTSSFCGSYTTNPGYTACDAGYQTGLANTSSCCNPGAATPTTTYTCANGTTPCAGNVLCYQYPGCTGNIVGNSIATTTYACYTSNTTYPTSYSGYTSTTTYPTTYSGYTSTSTINVTTYTTSIRIISSVSGSVVTDSTTAVTSNTTSYTNMASMQVNTSGNAITAKAYSAAGQVSQLGSTVTRTPTSPTKGASVGIIKAPTDANQGSTLDNYSAIL